MAIEESTSAEVTVAQVAAPRAESERTNWLVQEVPAYSATRPPAPVKTRAEVMLWNVVLPVTMRLVEVAVPATVSPPAAVPSPIVVEAVESNPPLKVSKDES